MRALALTVLCVLAAGCAHVGADADESDDTFASASAPRPSRVDGAAPATPPPPMGFVVPPPRDPDAEPFQETPPASMSELSNGGGISNSSGDTPVAPVPSDTSVAVASNTPLPQPGLSPGDIQPPPPMAAGPAPDRGEVISLSSTRPAPRPAVVRRPHASGTTADVGMPPGVSSPNMVQGIEPPPPLPADPSLAPVPVPAALPAPRSTTAARRRPVAAPSSADDDDVGSTDADAQDSTGTVPVTNGPTPVANGGIPIVQDAPAPTSDNAVFVPAVRPNAPQPAVQGPASNGASGSSDAQKDSAEKRMEELDRQLAEMDAQAKAAPVKHKAPAPPPVTYVTKPERQSEEYHFSAGPDVVARRARVAIMAALGPVWTSNSDGGYTRGIAPGIEFTWHPGFLGPVSLDGSYFYVGNSSSIPQTSVNEVHHQVAIRVLATADFRSGFFVGGGGGLLLTIVQAQLQVVGNSANAIHGIATQPGADGSIVAGFHYKYFITRLDLRVLLRAGSRLDFMPTLGAGVTF